MKMKTVIKTYEMQKRKKICSKRSLQKHKPTPEKNNNLKQTKIYLKQNKLEKKTNKKKKLKA